MVRNVHARRLPASPDTLGELIDTLSSARDRLWPHESWPRMKFDGELRPGAKGGHGPIRYEVADYEPGRRVRFRFTGPPGFEGVHEFHVEPVDRNQARLVHSLEGHMRGRALLKWPLYIRPLHNALIEDAFDKAEREATGRVSSPARWSPLVRALRRVGGRRKR